MTTATDSRTKELDLNNTIDLQEIYDYLDDLRESGETNMYGAGMYLMSEFGMKRRMASKVLSAWMKDFSK